MIQTWIAVIFECWGTRGERSIHREVGEKDFEVLAKLLRPVHERLIYGVELDQGPETSLNEIVGHGVILVQRFTKDFSEPPVVRYFVVVPLNIDGNF